LYGEAFYDEDRFLSDGPQQIIFVGGAPRSGTTVTHAVICTSDRTSRYHPEISFFRGLPIAFRNGRTSWRQHTSAFFADADAFRLLMRKACDMALHAVWEALDRSPNLCVKDPHLTPFFPDLNLLYPEKARFVVVVRDPRDVVRSRQEVHAKEFPDKPYTINDAIAVAHEYRRYYTTILRHNFAGRLFMFRYEDLDTDRIKDGIADFTGLDDLFKRPLWNGDNNVADDPWGSPKYNRSIDLGRRLSPLAPDIAEPVMTICQNIMDRFGYQRAHRI
jgi:hypothetical protein